MYWASLLHPETLLQSLVEKRSNFHLFHTRKKQCCKNNFRLSQVKLSQHQKLAESPCPGSGKAAVNPPFNIRNPSLNPVDQSSSSVLLPIPCSQSRQLCKMPGNLTTVCKNTHILLKRSTVEVFFSSFCHLNNKTPQISFKTHLVVKPSAVNVSKCSSCSGRSCSSQFL